MTDEYQGDQGRHTISVQVTSPIPRGAERYHGVYRTVTLTAAAAGKEIAIPSVDRVCLYVQALDDDICISQNQSDAEKGAGLIIPHTNTAPTPIYDQGIVYVAVPNNMGGPSSRVSVAAYYCTRE